MSDGATLIDGKYTILAKLREGGMGAIYKVHHNFLDETRVIKLMKPSVIEDPDLQKRFVQEAKMVTKFKHPNIAAVYDFAVDDDLTAYIVMEYIEGLNLAELSRGLHLMSVPLTIEVIRQSLLALSYLHRKNILHRDISPDNIMLMIEDERPWAKLIDLGIAKALDAADGMTKTGFFLGKLKYASPEQLGSLQGDEKMDIRSDLYSLGVAMYELLTGKLPFATGNAQQLVAGHLFQPPAPFEETDPSGRVPQELRALVMKTLSKSRNDRPATADDFLRDLLNIQDEMAAQIEPEEIQRITELISTHYPHQDTANITPSAQERMNKQFASQTRTKLQTGTGSASTARTVQEDTATVIESAKTTGRPITAKTAPPTIPPRPMPTPQPAAKRSGAMLGVIGGVVLAAAGAGGYFYLQSQKKSDPPAIPTATAAPTSTAIASPSTAVVPTATEIATTTIGTSTSSTNLSAPVSATIAPIVPPTDQSLLKEALGDARRAVNSARTAADRMGAPSRATAQYEAAARTQRDADVLATRGDLAAAIRKFNDAVRLFSMAETTAHEVASRPVVVPTATVAPPPPTATQVVEAPKPIEIPPPPPPPPPPASRPTVSAEDSIRQMMSRYVDAQVALDAGRYARIFPGIDKEKVSRAFAALRSQELDLNIRKIDVNGDSATVLASESRTAVPKVGSEQRVRGDRTFTLQRRGDDWIITSIR